MIYEVRVKDGVDLDYFGSSEAAEMYLEKYIAKLNARNATHHIPGQLCCCMYMLSTEINKLLLTGNIPSQTDNLRLWELVMLRCSMRSQNNMMKSLQKLCSIMVKRSEKL